MAMEELVTIENLIPDCIREVGIAKKIKLALFIVSSFKGTETYKRLDLKKEEQWLKKSVLRNMDLMRLVNYRQAITDSPESYMYFGRDKGERDPYLFEEDTEKIIQEIEERINDVMASIFKEVTGEITFGALN